MRGVARKEEPRRPAQKMHRCSCSLTSVILLPVKVARALVLGILERSSLLPALTHTPSLRLHLGCVLHALCHHQGDHFSELIELNILRTTGALALQRAVELQLQPMPPLPRVRPGFQGASLELPERRSACSESEIVNLRGSQNLPL